LGFPFQKKNMSASQQKSEGENGGECEFGAFSALQHILASIEVSRRNTSTDTVATNEPDADDDGAERLYAKARMCLDNCQRIIERYESGELVILEFLELAEMLLGYSVNNLCDAMERYNHFESADLLLRLAYNTIQSVGGISGLPEARRPRVYEYLMRAERAASTDEERAQVAEWRQKFEPLLTK
jgi:hypothetical protein